MIPEPKNENDPLNALLSDSVDHTPDDGFTRRVLSALPPRQSRRSYRFAILATAAVLCAIALLWFIRSSEWLSSQYTEIGPTALGYTLAIVLGMAATGWGLWDLVTDNDRR